ncbi:MAG TPA: TrkH family potassium uptake protein [Candidatus Atopostipes pullistercoris]|uniref:TrkH family potassium uptake protein n=1 Tax=Candidatus Atopostipes pullistercoris TaxID=2838467 RepID=A0A9D2G182_9LACT|nr:TrkH family potassium uptake protein [Candidatus Atopostipes pullistercoris]
MNKDIVRYVTGRILMVVAGLMFFPIVVSLIYREPIRYLLSFLFTAILMVGIGFSFSRTKMNTHKLYAKEGFIIVALSWILVSAFGALPFVISGDIPSFVDAFFETSSGFTTTGSSILTDVEALSHSMLFWRSFTHLIGGMGVLVFALAVLPSSDSESVHIMKAEMPGPTFGKLVSRLSSTARILYIIYFVMTLVVIFLLWLAGLPLFDSLLLSFGVAGTGGFGIVNGSIAPYNSVAIELILGIGMLIFGINFNLFFLMVNKEFKQALKNEELKWYLRIVGISIVLISINLVMHAVPVLTSLRDSFFTVSSVITTSGFSTALFEHWPMFSQLILLLLMFIGGMAGSTAGGLKVSRIAILVKSGIAELKRAVRPNRVVTVQFENKLMDEKELNKIYSYVIIYAFIFVATTLMVSFEAPDFISAFSTVATTINNIGPGLGAVGPGGNFSMYSPFIKVVLSFIMIMGRLEIFPVLILLSPNTWRKRI